MGCSRASLAFCDVSAFLCPRRPTSVQDAHATGIHNFHAYEQHPLWDRNMLVDLLRVLDVAALRSDLGDPTRVIVGNFSGRRDRREDKDLCAPCLRLLRGLARPFVHAGVGVSRFFFVCEIHLSQVWWANQSNGLGRSKGRDQLCWWVKPKLVNPTCKCCCGSILLMVRQSKMQMLWWADPNAIPANPMLWLVVQFGLFFPLCCRIGCIDPSAVVWRWSTQSLRGGSIQRQYPMAFVWRANPTTAVVMRQSNGWLGRCQCGELIFSCGGLESVSLPQANALKILFSAHGDMLLLNVKQFRRKF